jgi:serine phosphatase RsbU (regulator of sigma subunit)
LLNKRIIAGGIKFLDQRLALPIESIVKESLEDVNGFAGGAPRSDDITLLAIAYNG